MLVSVGVAGAFPAPVLGSKQAGLVPEQTPPSLPQTQEPDKHLFCVVPEQAVLVPHSHVPALQVSEVPEHVTPMHAVTAHEPETQVLVEAHAELVPQ